MRNFHQGFDKGLYGGVVQGALGFVTGGRGWGVKSRLETEAGHERMRRLDRHPQPKPPAVEPDGELTFDRLADVYNSGTSHEEDQPVHLQVADPSICVER